MRAWEFLSETNNRKPKTTLKHLNNMKHEQRWRQASHQRRIERTRGMYANTNWQREQLELERMRLELEQQRADLDATKAETEKLRAKAQVHLNDAAMVEIKHREKNRASVRKLASAEIRRKKA